MRVLYRFALSRHEIQLLCYRTSTSYTGSFRSHLCGKLSREHVGQQVSVCGWLHKKRMGEQFWLLRDWSGLLQILINEQRQEQWLDMLQKASLESVVAVRGLVQPRPEGQANLDMPTGEIEIHAAEMKLLNPALSNLPFLPHNRQVRFSSRM